MSFWEKFKHGVRQFMAGRHGADELTNTMVIIALVLMLFTAVTGSSLLNLISLILYGVSIFRMFSRNVAKRYEENRKFVEWRQKLTTSVSQRWVRLKNTKKYRYFKCPECGALLKLPRKVGEVTVTCGKCRHSFKQKA